MESELSADIQKNIPPVPIKTYQWEDLRRAREAGRYPWTHLLKVPLEGEITAEDIIRETTPRRSMSREFSKSRTHSPVDRDVQRILNLDSSPGSSRKHSEEGKDEGIHIPNFSKEISMETEDDISNAASNTFKRPESRTSARLVAPIEIPKSISPKSILKRRIPEQQYIGVTETREKTKCCHPLVNKIKHLADKTLHKLDKIENEKSPTAKRKKNEDGQEIRQLKSSPGAVRRQKFSAIKLGDSDEMSKTLSIDTPPARKKKEHIYEDIEESKNQDLEKSLTFSTDVDDSEKVDIDTKKNKNKENESMIEKKSIASQDPSLVTEDSTSLKLEDRVMEKLHKTDNINREAVLLDEEMDPDEPNVDEIFQNQLDESRPCNDSPNITITEILDDTEIIGDQSTSIPIESSPSPIPRDEKKCDVDQFENEWSKPNSDHEYEIIEKPPPNILYNAPTLVKTDDELSSTTSLERKYLQHTSDEDEQVDEKGNMNDVKNEEIMNAETLQKNIEDRYFLNTPSTVSRTECEVSTSQVDSSALENLPLKRDSRLKNNEMSIDSKIQQRIQEGTGKLKTQAGKLKTKLHNLRSRQFSLPEKPKINLPDRSKFKMPERPKISFPDRPKFTLPDRRKFSLPDRPKFKKLNMSTKLSFGDRKKFTLPERPKFNVPELPKFKMPARPKINFPSLGRKKETKVECDTAESSDSRNIATVDFETKTYPRLFNRKKKSQLEKTSSSPTLTREETPPATFTFTRVSKVKESSPPIITAYIPDSPEQPREYGDIDNDANFENDVIEKRQFETTYDFDKLDSEYVDDETASLELKDDHNATSIPDISPSNQEYTHVINEINNDEFFVRPRGISRENIQVREYLSDEIRHAFKIPKNFLHLMGSETGIDDEHKYANEPEADPELMIDENDQMKYSTEDLNDKDDGYYTFPPIRPSRAKRKKKENESIKYIDDSVNASMQFSEVDLELPEEHIDNQNLNDEVINNLDTNEFEDQLNFIPTSDLHSIHEYANDDVIEYPEAMPIQSQTLPMPPKRKKKLSKIDLRHSSLTDFKNIPSTESWEEPRETTEDIIVYRTEHEYTVPQVDMTVTEHSPLPPRRNRSRSSRGTSLCDDDRTSHGAESLTLDTHAPPTDEIEIEREIRYESPGYATVDKGSYIPSKGIRKSKSKSPPIRRRKSNSSERKYYTVGSNKTSMPDRPPRKKSSTSLMTLDSFNKRSVSGDLTQYVEIDEPQIEDVQKDLNSGEIVNKMKDRPLPPPPRPPRGSRRRRTKENFVESERPTDITSEDVTDFAQNQNVSENFAEIEVSTQTDPLPDDVDFELGMDENLDISMSSSLRDIVEDESLISKGRKLVESPRMSRPASRSEKSFKLSDSKISDLSKSNLGRTSPTVILVERRVSSPTRINEHEEMLTEASLTVQHIDIDESQIPDVPPLPRSRTTPSSQIAKNITTSSDERALERMADVNRDVQLDNLVTQRLQVRDLDVGRLNVSELQASKILVSDIEGMTLQVAELDSKSGHISVSGIEFSQSVIDEIVKKFAEISTIHSSNAPTSTTQEDVKMEQREEETQTDEPVEIKKEEIVVTIEDERQIQEPVPPPLPPPPPVTEECVTPPQRPPPPDLAPLLYSYLQDIPIPPTAYYPRSFRERPFTEFHETQHHSPPPPTRRAKRKSAAPQDESSSDENRPRPSHRGMPPPVRAREPTITEAGAQFIRVCHSSISRTIRNMFNSFMSYISGTEDKKDVQMALVIFLVLIAGLIMFGLSDSRTIHHHHWEFFNPPDGKQ